MAVVYVSANKLAEALGIAVKRLQEIEEFFDQDANDKWELKVNDDYRIIVKAGNHREYTESGAYAIASYLQENDGLKNVSASLKKFWGDRKRDIQKAFVSHKIIENSSSLMKRKDTFWLRVDDVVAILGTRPDFFAKIVQMSMKKGRLIDGIHFSRFDNQPKVYISLSGIYELSMTMKEIMTKKNRREWCQDVHDRIKPEIDSIVKFVSNRRKQIDKAKEEARKRDKNICQVTQKKEIAAAAHHLYSEAEYPQIAASLDNLITLSASVHTHFHQHMGGTVVPCTIDDFIHYVKHYYSNNYEVLELLSYKKLVLGEQQISKKSRSHVFNIPLSQITETKSEARPG